MAGHNKWSKIKRKKGANDAKRGKLFTKILKEIQVASKAGGPDLDGNPRLKTAVQTAKSNSVPNDNIDRAIKRGSEDDGGADYLEINYEGYGPAGVAILIKTLTDNRNRTVAEVRHALTKNGGSLGAANSVAFQFEDKGIFTLAKDQATEDELFESLLDYSIDDISDETDVWQVTSEVNDFGSIRDTLEKLGKTFEAEIQSVPKNLVKVEGSEAVTLIKLLEVLEDLDDVQSVSANFDISDEDMEVASQ